MHTVNFIGCGKVGKTLAALIKLNNAASIIGIVNSSLDSAKQAVEFIGEGQAFSAIAEMPMSDIYFITTQDDLISNICTELYETGKLNSTSIVIHCSGSISSTALQSARSAGAKVASVHPVRSFADPKSSIEAFAGTDCAFEGDDESFSLIKSLFEKIGGKLFSIDSERKTKYHAAMVMANNYATTLHYHAFNCLTSAGVDTETAKTLVTNLMTNALTNLNKLDYASALTGPIQRGDLNTIQSHLDALHDDAAIKEIYISLGLGTLPLTLHSALVLSELRKVLQSDISQNVHTSES